MDIKPIQKTIKTTVKDAVNNVNTLGNYCSKSISNAASKTPLKDLFEKTSKVNLKSYDFHGVKLSKDTAVGAAVITAAVALAIGCVKGIANAVKKIKED